ncbi:hypothetical protein [Xanthobacter sp. VNH20]|uniref:hypothetical protein n=1 Tax=Xanthobacter sp. VNH20 TaxID=3156616 RepID=UPI0032B3A7AF
MRESRFRHLGLSCAAQALSGATFFALAWGASAQAADLAAAPPSAPAPVVAVSTADTPVFYGTLYLWASSLSGRTSTLPNLPPADIDLSFKDLLKNLNGAVMATGEMRIGRWGFLADVMFTQVTPTGTLPGPLRSDIALRARSLTLSADVLYRLYESTTLNIDAGAGLRYWHLGNQLSIEPAFLPASFSVTQSEDWADPVIAARIQAQLGGPWSMTLVGDIGGFGVGSNSTWQAIGTLNYQWNDKLALRAGYRALSVDYENGSFLYDVLMQGPIVGATYRF